MAHNGPQTCLDATDEARTVLHQNYPYQTLFIWPFSMKIFHWDDFMDNKRHSQIVREKLIR